MSIYDDEMYNYLTVPENYKAAKDVANLLSNEVEPRLNEEFWDKVKQLLEGKLRESLKEEEKVYEVDEKVENIKKSNWSGVTISRENNDLGIKIDIDLIDSDEVRKLLSQKNSDKHLGDKISEPWWPCFYHFPFDCSENLFNKLPSTRETLISELVNFILKYIGKATDACDEINKLKK